MTEKAKTEFTFTRGELEEFLNAKTYEERLKILIAHSRKNSEIINRRYGNMSNINEKTEAEVRAEMELLSEQFSEFLHTKGIGNKFRLAFSNMAESARKQHEHDKAQLEAVKAKSAEENRDFIEFLHAKGFKAKCRLVIENIKRGARESSAKTAADIAKAKARANGTAPATSRAILSAEDLTREFNAFLANRGLDGEYKVVVEDK